MRASGAAAEMWYTVTAEFEVSATLRAGGDFHTHLAIDSRYVDLGAECGVDHTDVLFTQDEVAFAGEMLVWFDTEIDVEITFGATSNRFTAFAQANRRTIVDTSWNLDRDLLFASLSTTAMADSADLFSCLLYTSPSPRDRTRSRMPSSA